MIYRVHYLKLKIRVLFLHSLLSSMNWPLKRSQPLCVIIVCSFISVYLLPLASLIQVSLALINACPNAACSLKHSPRRQ